MLATAICFHSGGKWNILEGYILKFISQTLVLRRSISVQQLHLSIGEMHITVHQLHFSVGYLYLTVYQSKTFLYKRCISRYIILNILVEGCMLQHTSQTFVID